MQRVKTIAVALVVLGVAVGAAYLLFGRRGAAPQSTGQSETADEARSRNESPRLGNVPLQVPPESGTSPAIGLYDPAARDGEGVAPSGNVMPARLDRLEPTPELAARYRSFLDAPTSSTGDRIADTEEKRSTMAENRRLSSPQPARRHEIVDGDTLAELAQRYLGSSDRWTEIYQANRQALSDPELLPIGLELVIPGDSPSAVRDATTSSPAQSSPRGSTASGDEPSPDERRIEDANGSTTDGLVPVP
jgi:hypothetical protein